MSDSLWCTPEELGTTYASSEYAFEACKTASFLLWGLSGRKFSGYSTITETYEHPVIELGPNLSDALQSASGNAAYFILRTADQPQTRVRLRGKPVRSITSVTLSDDTIVDPTEYTLIDHSTLKFEYELTHDIQVTYNYGGTVPVAGNQAARMLATQFVMLWSDDDDCSLPTRVTSISRQGVTFTILDDQDFIADLRTGVYAVDLFLKTVNPDGARRRAKVFSPDIRRGYRRNS